MIAKKFAIELVARDVEPRARCSVVERQVALRLSRDDETAMTNDVRHAIVRRRRDNLIRMHAKSTVGIITRIELCPCVELHLVGIHVHMYRLTANNLQSRTVI